MNKTTPISRGAAERLDHEDPLRNFGKQFITPTKSDLKSKTLTRSTQAEQDLQQCIYLCGNSLGLQPRRYSERINEHLQGWATKGVFGHFVKHEGTTLPPWLDIDDMAAEKMAPLVGALKQEVAIMETLTANLHLLMASFYRPTKEKYKIILEGKAFPSDHVCVALQNFVKSSALPTKLDLSSVLSCESLLDRHYASSLISPALKPNVVNFFSADHQQYAVYSQIRHHGLKPEDCMILIEPAKPSATITTEQILATIDQHASSIALVLLPGIQYYTGQLLDIKTITSYAHSKGLTIGWDLAHAVGNVELSLHEWEADFAAWCTYKYVNSGPGSIAGLFVHEKHGKVNEGTDTSGIQPYRPRLSGWWGGDKGVRFNMAPEFVPQPGAAGFQVGNPSALAITGLLASLEVFAETTMQTIRTKSIKITAFLERLLLENSKDENHRPYWIITPSDPSQRGAQLSVQLEPNMLDPVLEFLEEAGVVVDERKPDVIRVAPAPLYNSYVDVFDFVEIFKKACQNAKARKN